MRCGSETISGLGSREQQARSAGANSLDLAVAMLETTTMTTNYPYGDNKTGDSANFGIFKQNWLMPHSACGQFRNQSTSQWNNGAALNNNLSADVSCLHQSQNHYGINRWFAGHRNGESGLNNPNTGDINGYKDAIYRIQNQINSNSANLSNNTRFWVDATNLTGLSHIHNQGSLPLAPSPTKVEGATTRTLPGRAAMWFRWWSRCSDNHSVELLRRPPRGGQTDRPPRSWQEPGAGEPPHA